jgi:hypothetical protein
MSGNLDAALRALLIESLPGLLDGAPPPVGVNVVPEGFDADPDSADATAGEPRPEDRQDDLPFEADPSHIYSLSQPPYPGTRRLWLVQDDGLRFTLHKDEVRWDKFDSRLFRLTLRPNRSVEDVTGVRVLYGVTAIFTKMKLSQTLSVRLESDDAARLHQAEALAVAVIHLNQQRLLDAARALYEDGDYSAAVEVKSFRLAQGTRPTANVRFLSLHVEYELKASRALAEGEGTPIERILTPGRATSPDRRIDIDVQIDA